MTIGEQIVAARKARGWSAGKLSRVADVVPATLRAIESDQPCRDGSLARVAKALGLAVETQLVKDPDAPQGAQGAA